MYIYRYNILEYIHIGNKLIFAYKSINNQPILSNIPTIYYVNYNLDLRYFKQIGHNIPI